MTLGFFRGTLAAISFTFIAASFSGCSDGPEQKSAQEELAITYELRTLDQFQQPVEVFNQGEDITFQLALQNTTSGEQSLDLYSSQQYEFLVLDEREQLLWQWSRDTGQVFLPSLSKLTLEPYSIREFNVEWHQKLSDNSSPESGHYTVRAYIPGQDRMIDSPIEIR